MLPPLADAQISLKFNRVTILGAASNIIIIDVAESKNVKTFTFFEFFKIGVLVTLANIVIYYLFITYL